jgi:hypothetical protein
MVSRIVFTDIKDIYGVKKANFFTQERDPYCIRKFEKGPFAKPGNNVIANQRQTVPHVDDHNKLLTDARIVESNIDLALLSKSIKTPIRSTTMTQNHPESLKTSYE